MRSKSALWEDRLICNLERLNGWQYYARSEEGTEQGFRKIVVTEAAHPYISRWWPSGHIIGWEHTFVHEIADRLTAVARHEAVSPDFYDGVRCQQVLDAASQSATEQKWIAVPKS